MWAYFIFSFGFEIMHPLLSCSRMQCTCRCGSVHISLTHTTRSLIACSLARSLTHSHSGTQSGGGTLTSRWLSRSSHHSERRHSHISLALSLFTSRWLARSLIRTQALRAAALSHLAGSLALHITLCLLSRSLALPCVCRSRSRVSRCAGPGLAPVCVPGARPPVCRESYNCVNIITTASVTVTLSRMAQVMCTCVAT